MSTFYGWLGVTSTKLADANNANGMKDQALNAWTHLSQYTLVFVVIMLLFGIGMAVFYYTEDNNQPGRHYHPKRWIYVGIVAAILSGIITFVLEMVLQKTNGIEGIMMMEVTIAAANLLYSAGLYLLVSLIWCNIPQLPTNAYRILKV